MIKKIITLSVIAVLFSFSNFAQEALITKQKLENLIGCWQGSITYLDYTTKKPFSMPVNLTIKSIKKSNNFMAAVSYPNEPEANSIDTIVIGIDGRTINDEVVLSNRMLDGNMLELITELKGRDGNDNMPATFRFTYLINSDKYSKKKEVQFEGTSEWITRHEFKYKRCNN